MKIGVDLDDVVIDFVPSLLEFYQLQTGKKISFRDVISYDLEEVWGGTKQEAIDIVRSFYQSTQCDHLLALPGALNALTLFHHYHDVIFVTSRFGEAKEKTSRWLHQYCSFQAPVLYVGEYQLYEHEQITKADICLREKISCIIEDNGHYALECSEKGIKTYLFHRPWNRNINSPRITKVSRWIEIIDSLL